MLLLAGVEGQIENKSVAVQERQQPDRSAARCTFSILDLNHDGIFILVIEAVCARTDEDMHAC